MLFRSLAPHQQLDAEAVLKAYQGLRLLDLADNQAWLGGASPRLAHAAETVGRIMLDAHLLRRPAELARLSTDAYLQGAG